MDLKLTCPIMIFIVINLTLITLVAATNTIDHDVTTLSPSSTGASSLSSSSSVFSSILSRHSPSPTFSNGKHFIDQLVSNGTLDRVPGKVLVNLLDPLTDGLISQMINNLKPSDSGIKMISLVGLSGLDLLQLTEEQSKGKLSKTLKELKDSQLIERWTLINHPSHPDHYYWASSSSQVKRAGPDSMSGWTVGSSKRSPRSVQGGEEFSDEPEKRNFDEIDRQAFAGFAGKRNFDEIDRQAFTGFTAGKRNFDEIDRSGLTGFRGRRNFDEIDRSSFSGFTGGKRGSGQYYIHQMTPLGYYFYPVTVGSTGTGNDLNGNSNNKMEKKNFDEIDRSGLTGFRGRRNFDEIDSSGFTGFYKRNFDEIDRSAFSGFAKRPMVSSNSKASKVVKEAKV